MGPMSSLNPAAGASPGASPGANPGANPGVALGPADRAALLEIARASIARGLREGRPLDVDPATLPPGLLPIRATFVTLHIQGRLRGCIGTLEATRPLGQDVARNAHAAAFHDPRFPMLADCEFPRLDIHLSILSPATPLTFRSEEDLIGQLRPGVDGLILYESIGAGGERRGTFLPAVWETIPAPREFLRHLKMKAGLSPDYWSPTLRVERYTAEGVP
jgi:uncharacterized protein